MTAATGFRRAAASSGRVSVGNAEGRGAAVLDPLDEFPSEGTGFGNVAPAVGPASSDASRPPNSIGLLPTLVPTLAAVLPERAVATGSVSLASVVARDLPLRWEEAVAVVEELCAVLASRGVQAIPALGAISITSAGTLAIDFGPGDYNVRALGRLLHTLLASSAPPASLRLFAVHSMSTATYDSIDMFRRELARFAAADRRDMLIRALHQQFQRGPVQVLQTSVDDPRAVGVPPITARLTALPLVLTAGIAALASSLAVGAWLWNTSAVIPSRALTNAPFEAPAPLAPSWSAVQSMDFQPLGNIVALAGTTTDPRGTSRSRSAPFVPVEETPETVAVADLSGTSAELAPAAPGVATSASPRIDAVSPLASRPDEPIYTHSAADVQPPVMMSPQLVPLSPLEANPYGTNNLELLIDEAGRVVQARLASRPLRMPDMMILSGAKMWKFRPAIKDGKPVKYRLLLDWTVVPR